MVKKKIRRAVRVSKYVLYKETLVDYKEKFWSFMGAFLGVGLIAFCQADFLPKIENVFLIGSFGASSVLVYGAIQSPLAQPRNLIGGHVVSALIGVTVYKIFPDIVWLTAPLAVAFSIIAMQFTKTLHPPGGATALLAVTGTEKIKSLGYMYAFSPVLTGVSILLLVALVFNNLTKHRSYPTNSKLTRFFKRKSWQ
ncbi:HPP family protein [Hymenobacter sp. H14-R3]|uniref:HPP family protein n=1 Tax=Hymenobacter sp. H14-R3 TaxID=3046308 RepID=UPI0024BB54A6|nr:HPP family protein [Hymenobacter sp. H14-R3]MDJ0366648.1 HPP family protein [Hymenobacter sp. H14-R3]